MPGSRFNRDYGWLAWEVSTGPYLEMLRRLQERAPVLIPYQSWEEVFAFMRGGSPSTPERDAVFRAIFLAYALDRDPCWKSLLLAMLWPKLLALSQTTRRWDPDQQERLQNIVVSFLKTVDRVDVGKRPGRFFQKLVNDVIHRTYQHYHAEWRRTERWCSAPLPDLEAMRDTRQTALERRELEEVALVRLKGYWDLGWISEGGRQVIAQTRIFGKSLPAYARSAGISHQAAKRRRWRAERAIRRRTIDLTKGGQPMSEKETGNGKGGEESPCGEGRPGRPERLRPCDRTPGAGKPPAEKVPAILGNGKEGDRCA